MNIITRYHDISCGHRVFNHAGKCRHLHGHNYRIHFKVASDLLDDLGMVIDFVFLKEKLCAWLEENWDHKFLLWSGDPILNNLQGIDKESIVALPFNPTAENMAEHLVNTIAPQLLKNTNCTLISCIVEETRKCSAEFKL